MKLIDFLLRLYPREFRARFEADMRAFHVDRLREGEASMARISIDHVSAAMREQAQAVKPDVRLALRGIARRPLFASIIILTIALGVGANAAIFSVVNALLLRPLPYPDSERLVFFGHEPPHWLLSEPQYAEYRANLRTFASLAAYTSSEATLSAGEPERIDIASVTPNFFETLGVLPARGRAFAVGEDQARPSPLVIISHRLWQSRFGGAPDVVGKTFLLNNNTRTVVGVMPEGFGYPSPETQVWLPICSQRECASLARQAPDTLDGWGNHYLWVVGRLQPPATLAQARQEARLIANRIMTRQPETFDPATPLTPNLERISDRLVGKARPYLLALFGAVGVVLLIGCVNVANLLLARGEGRSAEMALRTALGASRRRLATQLLTEIVVYAVAGGLLGLAIGWWAQRALVVLAPSSLPRLDEIRLDWPVVLFGFVVSVGAGLLAGVVPALRASRQDPAESLKASGRTLAHTRGTSRTRRALVVAEVALAMVMLTGAAMLIRSLLNVHNADLGYSPANVMTMRLSPGGSAYSDARTIDFYSTVLERIQAIPGVQQAGAARWLPIADAGGLWDIRIEGEEYPPGQAPAAVPQEITPGYIGAMGMRVLAGRDFSYADRDGAAPVALISKAFAERFWGAEDPLGKRFRLGGRDSGWMSVVGVVNDLRARGFDDIPEPTMYIPLAQAGQSSYIVPRALAVVVRTGGSTSAVVNPVRAVVKAIDATVPVSRVRTLSDIVATSTANRRFSTWLIGGFGALALVLAGIGIYGLLSYAVSERTFEIGVRVALGADRGNVLGLVVGDAVRVTLWGVVAGVLGSVALGRVIRSLLVGVPMIDGVSLGFVALLLATVAVVASAVPARRAASLDPTRALRAGG
jgi:putative ABC transport system permease protein